MPPETIDTPLPPFYPFLPPLFLFYAVVHSKAVNMSPVPFLWTWSPAPWIQSAPGHLDSFSDLTTLSLVSVWGVNHWVVYCKNYPWYIHSIEVCVSATAVLRNWVS